MLLCILLEQCPDRSPSFSQDILECCFSIISSLARNIDILDLTYLSRLDGPIPMDCLLSSSSYWCNLIRSYLTDPNIENLHTWNKFCIRPNVVYNWLRPWTPPLVSHPRSPPLVSKRRDPYATCFHTKNTFISTCASYYGSTLLSCNSGQTLFFACVIP